MKLRDQWISGADCITIEDYMMIRRVLYCICAGGGGPECQRYLQNFADGFVVIDSLKENFILHCFSILTRRQCESKEVASFVHKHRYHFSVNAQSSDSTPICSLHWLTSGFKALNLFAASRALEPDNAPKMFPLPIRYLWSSGDVIIQASPADLPDAVTKSSLVRWCPTLHLSLRIIYYLWEAIKISNDEENSAGCEPNRLQAWRLLYAVMSSYAIDAECETPYVESETLSGMPRLISLLPRPLALAVQIAIMECAVSLPQDLLFHVNLIERSLGNKEDIGSAIPRIPRALRSRIASMDTLMLADRIDIALNSLTSILLLQKFYSANEELIAKPWEAAVRSSSVWSWSKVCQISKARRMLLDEQKGYDAVDISLHNGPRKNTFDIDGLQQMLISTYSRFPADERVREACRIVDSKKEVFLRIMRTPDMDDAAYKAKLQQRLQFYCRKSLAASIGRGMMTLSSMSALMAEPLTIPPLNLSGRVPPLGALINLESMTAEHLLWPEFHNGVAAGLRVRNSSSTSSTSELSLMQIYTDLKSKYYNRADRLHSAQLAGTSRDPHDRAMRYWVLYNHKAAADSSHAGVLLAFGLLGHLKVLSAPDISDFLTACHQPTTIAMLIGLAASRLGSSDNFTSKTICLYFPSLIPTGQSNSDIEVPVLVQAAALTGLGLLNAGSGNRIMAEFLFSELTKRPATEKGMDCREVYALSAAWALGMLAIGRGAANNKQAHDKNLNSEESEVIADLRLDVRLLRCIEGGHSGGLAYDGLGDGADKARLRSRVPNSYAMDLNANSSTIIEPEYSVNTAATSFGAIIALGLMHIQTENGAIAARLHVPETNYALESERPDLLFARALVQCLIQWKRVENACIGDASRATLWLNDQIPQVRCFFVEVDVT